MGGISNAMFSILPMLVIVGFVIIIGMFIITAVRGARQWHKNNQSTVLTVDAEMVTKRAHTSVSHHHTGTDNAMTRTSSRTSYYATFEVTSGDRMEFHVSSQEYGMLVEGDKGRLTFQGTRYQGFERTK